VLDSFGQTIRVDAGVDVTGYDSVYMRFKKAGATTWIEKTGTPYSTQYVDYVVLSGDDLFDTEGEMRVTIRAETGSTVNYKSPKCAILKVVVEGGY
jgi:hypothetical protein